MADLNTLLRWAIENSDKDQLHNDAESSKQDGMQTKFKPAAPGQAPSKHNATLHKDDQGVSPASTPGPATPTDEKAPEKSELTSDIIDLILGKPDSMTMKEKMEYATNDENDVESRVEALDDFEMLIEMIDNANNMTALKLWEPLFSLLFSDSPEIVRHALWIIGTAVQNNLKAQASFFFLDGFNKVLESIAKNASQPATRQKGAYALSNALKYWPLATAWLSANNNRGYDALKVGVTDSAPPVRRKYAFLVGNLVMQAGTKYEGDMALPEDVKKQLVEKITAEGGKDGDLLQGLEENGVFNALIEGVKIDDDHDIEFEENALRTLSNAAEKGGLSSQEKQEVKSIWNKWGEQGQKERGFEGSDAQQVEKALA